MSEKCTGVFCFLFLLFLKKVGVQLFGSMCSLTTSQSAADNMTGIWWWVLFVFKCTRFVGYLVMCLYQAWIKPFMYSCPVSALEIKKTILLQFWITQLSNKICFRWWPSLQISCLSGFLLLQFLFGQLLPSVLDLLLSSSMAALTMLFRFCVDIHLF